MTKRKIIKQAKQAYTITLPIGWIRKNNLSEKSEINISEEEKNLIISSENSVKGEKIKIDASDLDIKEIYFHINALYAKGIDEIEIISDKDISSKIMKSINYNLGYALVSQEKNKITIKDIGGGKYENLDEIFKRVFQMILLFYESAIKDIFGEQKETLESLRTRDLEVNKFCLYLQRAINKMSYPNPINGRILFTYSFALEKISDEIHRLWRTNIEYEIKKTKQLKELLESSSEGLGKAFDLYYQFNPKKVKELYDLRDKIRKKSMEIKKLDADTSRFIRHVIKIVEDATDLNHLTLMIKLESKNI